MKNNPVLKFNSAVYAMNESIVFDLKSPEGTGKLRNMLGERYIRHYPKAMDRIAQQTNLLPHMYELNHNGHPRYRLFKMIRKNHGISILIRPAKMLTPLSEEQKTPGIRKRTGRAVKVTKRYRFPARPFVFEFGTPVVIKRKNTKVMWTYNTWPIPPLQGPVVIKHPRYTGKFNAATKEYFASEGRMILSDTANKYARYAARKAKRMAVAAK